MSIADYVITSEDPRRPKQKKEMYSKFRCTVEPQTLLFGRESWTIKARDTNRVEMRYMEAVKGCTRPDHIENEDIRKIMIT